MFPHPARRCVRLLTILALSVSAGCAVGNSATFTLSRTTTIGQELIDLQSAKEKGVLNVEEYARAKADIMKQASWEHFTKRDSTK